MKGAETVPGSSEMDRGPWAFRSGMMCALWLITWNTQLRTGWAPGAVEAGGPDNSI